MDDYTLGRLAQIFRIYWSKIQQEMAIKLLKYFSINQLWEDLLGENLDQLAAQQNGSGKFYQSY